MEGYVWSHPITTTCVLKRTILSRCWVIDKTTLSRQRSSCVGLIFRFITAPRYVIIFSWGIVLKSQLALAVSFSFSLKTFSDPTLYFVYFWLECVQGGDTKVKLYYIYIYINKWESHFCFISWEHLASFEHGPKLNVKRLLIQTSTSFAQFSSAWGELPVLPLLW